MAHHKNVSYIKPSQPSFLKDFKTKVGYKEPDTVETKKAKHDAGDDKRYIEEELPTVVMEGSSATEEEYKRYMKEQSEASVKDKPPSPIEPSTESSRTSTENVRIVFKKPKKRTSSEASDGGQGSSGGGLYSSTKRNPAVSEQRKHRRKSNDNKVTSSGRVKNLSLLSFEDDEN